MAAWVHLFGTSPAKVDKKKVEKASKRVGTTAHEYYKALLRLRVEADYYTVPSDHDYADWQANWERANAYASNLIKKVSQFAAR